MENMYLSYALKLLWIFKKSKNKMPNLFYKPFFEFVILFSKYYFFWKFWHKIQNQNISNLKDKNWILNISKNQKNRPTHKKIEKKVQLP